MENLKQLARAHLAKVMATRESMILASFTAALSLLVLIWLQRFLQYRNFWTRLGLKGEPPANFAVELFNLFARNRFEQARARVRRFGKLHGIFLLGRPRLVVADAELVRQICVRDFDKFQNHHQLEWANKYLRNFLVWLRGDHWKRVRAMMSPQFTATKMRRMHKLLDACAEDLLENFREQLIWARRDGRHAAQVDLYETYGLYTMDAITSCCYGLKLQRERGDLDISRASARNTLVRDCNQMLTHSWFRLGLLAATPRLLLKAFGFELTPAATLEPLVGRVEKLIEMRRADSGAIGTGTGAGTNVGANAGTGAGKGKGKGAGAGAGAGADATPTKYDDFLQMLIEAKLDDELELNELDQAENHHASLTRDSLISDQAQLKSSLSAANNTQVGDAKQPRQHRALATKLSDLEILSEALFLLVAGLDTTRSSMSTITYLLAHNPDCQERLYEELSKIAIVEDTPVGHRVSFDYEQLAACAYLDAVVCESLRFFGPVPQFDRVAEADYFIDKYNVRLPKGMQVLLNMHLIHHDPDYWRQPERFDPERFMPGQRERIVPGSYAPFSMGPRHCLGMRFSLSETKLGLAKVLMAYKFAPAPNTRYPPEPTRSLALISVRNCRVHVTYRDELD